MAKPDLERRRTAQQRRRSAVLSNGVALCGYGMATRSLAQQRRGVSLQGIGYARRCKALAWKRSALRGQSTAA
jgi:hypothetical protein